MTSLLERTIPGQAMPDQLSIGQEPLAHDRPLRPGEPVTVSHSDDRFDEFYHGIVLETPETKPTEVIVRRAGLPGRIAVAATYHIEVTQHSVTDRFTDVCFSHLTLPTLIVERGSKTHIIERVEPTSTQM